MAPPVWDSGPAAAYADGERAAAVATALVEEVGPRPFGSPAAERAQRWIERGLRERGWAPVRAPGPEESTVVACRDGERPDTLLLLAHPDTTDPRVPGANDNASGVAVLLVAAEGLPERPPRRVCLAFPSGEELGLLGSRDLAYAWDHGDGPLAGMPLELVVSLDIVGRGTLVWNGLGPLWGGDRLRALLAAAPAGVPWVYRAMSYGLPHMERSDHAPFAARGVPALHLFARAEGGIYAPYHSRDDTPDRLEAATLARAVALIRGLATMPPLPEEPPGEPAVVLGGAVVPGAATVAVAAAGAVAGAVGALGWAPWRAELGGWLRLVAGHLVAALAAVLAAFATAAGRDPTMALTSWCLLAGWGAWGLVAALWPWRAPAATGRRFAALTLGGLAAACAAVGLWLVAAPIVALGAAVLAAAALSPGTSARGHLAALGLAAVAAAPASYFLSGDHARELAFHGLVPASPGAWAVMWATLAAPAWGLLQGRAVPSGRARVGLAAAFAALLVVAAVVGWRSPTYAAPFGYHEALHP